MISKFPNEVHCGNMQALQEGQALWRGEGTTRNRAPKLANLINLAVHV